jgi:hypothetical protein
MTTAAVPLPAWLTPGAHITDHTTAWDPVPGIVLQPQPWHPPRPADAALLVEWLDGTAMQEWLQPEDATRLRCGLVHLEHDPCMQCELPDDDDPDQPAAAA